MSSRAFRRLHKDVDVIRLGRGSKDAGEEEEEEDIPVFQPQNKKGRSKGFVQPVKDPFELVS